MADIISRGALISLLKNSNKGTGAGIRLPNSFYWHAVGVQGNGNISTGVVVIEAALSEDYNGAWSLVDKPITVAANGVVFIQFVGLFPALRARIATDIVGGTTSVTYIGTRPLLGT